MSQFKLKVRQWAVGRNVENPFDVVILNTETGIMHCSPRTLSESDARILHLDLDNVRQAIVLDHLKDWAPDGTAEDFDAI